MSLVLLLFRALLIAVEAPVQMNDSNRFSFQ